MKIPVSTKAILFTRSGKAPLFMIMTVALNVLTMKICGIIAHTDLISDYITYGSKILDAILVVEMVLFGKRLRTSRSRLHSKLITSERRIKIGSCNINRKSFTFLDELAAPFDNDDSQFAADVRSSIRKAFGNAECIGVRSRISYDPVFAALETAVM